MNKNDANPYLVIDYDLEFGYVYPLEKGIHVFTLDQFDKETFRNIEQIKAETKQKHDPFHNDGQNGVHFKFESKSTKHN